MPAKPFQMALRSLIIQKQYCYSDRKQVEQITENPYYQYFVGLFGFQNKPPFVPSLLVEFRKRLNDEIMIEINEIITAYNTSNDQGPGDGSGSDLGAETEEPANSGTIILDAACAPQNISDLQDINLLNEARENLERMIDGICYDHNYYRPRHVSRERKKGLPEPGKVQKAHGKKDSQGNRATAAVCAP